MIDVRPFTLNELPELAPYLESIQAIADLSARMSMLDGANVQVWGKDHRLAAGGLQLLHPGVAEAWMVLTPHAKRQALSLARTIRAWLEDRIRHFHLHRIQALVRPDHPEGIRLLTHLHMSYEGTLRQLAADRTDRQMYAWVQAKQEADD